MPRGNDKHVSKSSYTASILVGVIVTREEIDSEWVDHRWVPTAILLGESSMQDWQEVKREPGKIHYFAGTTALELFRKETIAYVANLNEPVPAAYIIMRPSIDPEGPPLDLHLVTASPWEAQTHMDEGNEIVATIPIPPPLLAWVKRVTDGHHVEEKCIKRRRDKLDIEAPMFGQQPIFERRKNGNGSNDGSGGSSNG